MGGTARWWPSVLALLGGLLQAGAFAVAPDGGVGHWPGWALPGPTAGASQVVGLLLLVTALNHMVRPRSGAWAGWLFGTAAVAGSVWWLYISMHRYGGLPAWMAALAVLLLAASLSLYLAAAGAAYVRWRRGDWTDVPLWAALFLLAELARARWLTGFPWAAAGYAHVDGPLAAWAPWLGVYGIGAVAAGSAALLARLLTRAARDGRPWGSAVALVLLWVAPRLLPADFSSPAGTLSVTLIQGNVPQDEKFDPARLPQTLDWHLRALDRAQADLVVTAETAIPLLPSQMPEGLWEGIQRRFAPRSTAVLFGVPLGDYDTGYTNSVIGLGAGLGNGKPAYRYDKFHLVPFGEFIPTGFRWFVAMMNIPLGDFNRGPLVAPSMPVHGQRIAPNICYEDLFGEELAARFIDASQAPTILANMSNIGWFGHTVAITQHLQISRMRALELQRPMLRATNTGATVIIDHHGAVTASLAPYTQDELTSSVQGREGLTPYAQWASRWGTWPLWMVALVALGVRASILTRRGLLNH